MSTSGKPRGHTLLRRQVAIEQTRARFKGVSFAWGRADCWHMARFLLRAMGHRPPGTPRYRSAIGAKRALASKGFASIEEALDSMLPRIAPAAMLPGDIAVMEGDGPLSALTICVGEKIFGWHGDFEGAVDMTPSRVEGAWRT